MEIKVIKNTHPAEKPTDETKLGFGTGYLASRA